MNSSLRSADPLTHVKIVVVALIAAIVVVLVGTSAHVMNSTETAMIAPDRIVVKAAKPSTMTMKEAASIR
jgi:hypothetical protein